MSIEYKIFEVETSFASEVFYRPETSEEGFAQSQGVVKSPTGDYRQNFVGVFPLAKVHKYTEGPCICCRNFQVGGTTQICNGCLERGIMKPEDMKLIKEPTEYQTFIAFWEKIS
jgi:hypothetical protein